jgi:hypothetical protein
MEFSSLNCCYFVARCSGRLMILGSCCIPLNLVPLGGFRDLLLWGINDYLEEKKTFSALKSCLGFFGFIYSPPLLALSPSHLPCFLLLATSHLCFAALRTWKIKLHSRYFSPFIYIYIYNIYIYILYIIYTYIYTYIYIIYTTQVCVYILFSVSFQQNVCSLQ